MLKYIQSYSEPMLDSYKFNLVQTISDIRIKMKEQEDKAIAKAMGMVFGPEFEFYPEDCIAKCRVECYPAVDKYYTGDKLFLEIVKYKYNQTTGNFEGSYRIYS